MIRFFSVLLLLVVQLAMLASAGAAKATAADITITGPTKPIKPGRMFRLYVNGLTEQDMLSLSATVDMPAGVNSEDVDIFPGTWQRKTYIDFMSQTPGKYAVTVNVNLFRRNLDEALSATTAAEIDPDLTTELRIVVTKITDKYQAKSGSVLVEVAGSIPPPPDPDIPPVTSGLVWTIIIRTVDTMTADQSEVLSNLRQWTDQQPFDKVAHYEVSPSAVGPDGSIDKAVATWVAKMPATAKQPYVFIAAKDTAGKSSILWQGELPAKADDVINKIKERVKP